MENKTQSPFAGGPRTEEDTDKNGQPRITVWLSGLTPLCVKIADRLAIGCAALTTFSVPYAAYRIAEAADWQFGSEQYWQFGVALAAPAATYFGVKCGLYRVFTNTACVVFTPKHFVVKSLFGDKRYDRDQPHSFALHLHKKAKREEEKLSYRDSKSLRRWWQGARKRYYARSCHLSFQYFDQRNDIRTIYGMTDSQTCLTRLTACNQMMDRYKLQGPEQAMSPENDWPSQSGDL